MLPDDGVGAETTVISYPTSTEALGRGIDLSQSGMKKLVLFRQLVRIELLYIGNQRMMYFPLIRVN